jgi:hypothetical protein
LPYYNKTKNAEKQDLKELRYLNALGNPKITIKK